MSEKEVILKLYHNVDMGVVGIESIEGLIDSEKFLNVIKKEKEEYKRLAKMLAKLCKKYDIQKIEISPVAKISSEVMVMMKTIKDSSVSHLAKMMIEGTNKGLIELELLQNHYEKDKEIKEMISNIIKLEQNNIEELKVFL